MHLTYNEINSQHVVKQSLPLGGDLEGFYAFNAKELDEENNMYYYSARYYAPPTFISRDPLMDEKPWLSPYHYCSNNPMNRIDPTGALDILDNYTILSDGTIYKEETNDPTNTYTYIDQNGNSVDLGTYNVTSNSYGEDMVQAGTGANGSNSMYSWHNITSGNLYYEEDAFAGLLAGIQDFYNSSQVPFRSPDKVQINQFMDLNRIHSKKGNRHSSLDVAFYRNDRTTGAHASDNDASYNLNLQLFYSLKKFGLGSKGVFTAKSENSRTPYIPGTTGLTNHHHHFHFEGFNNNIIPTNLPTIIIRICHPIIYH